MSMLALIPVYFSDSEYFASVFFSIMFLTLSYTAIVIPFLFPKLNKVVKGISNLIGGWFVAGLIVEIYGFFKPIVVDHNDTTLYVKFLIMFIVGVVFLITNVQWSQNK